ncbi:MAG: extracellular solute-binding protein, partial [Firmicutes bacterium]|nr:extracellular solute-binding protein [Bacillota bacterium]
EYTWLNYPGGPEKAIQDGVIADLTPIINKYAPNLRKIIRSNREVDKMVKTDTGKYYVFPFLRLDDSLVVYMGPMLRADWLKELGLEVPTTIDEWYTVLKAFKEKKGADSPLVIPAIANVSLNAIRLTGAFIGAFGIKYDFYVEKGKVKYGPAEPAFKDFLATMHKWYKEGLLDKDLGVTDRKGGDAKILAGRAGALVGYAGGDMGKYLDSMKDKDPKFDLVGAPYPTLKKGQKPKFGHRTFPYPGNNSVAISAKCKYKELAARWLDYAYSPEGHMLFNFGIEGVSYKMVNGYPKYTDLIMKNPQLSVAEAMAGYMRASLSGPFVQDPRYFEQYQSKPQQIEAIKRWANTDEAKYALPPVTPTPEESTELANIMNQIDTYREEMVMRFILGIEPLDNFDKYLAQMKKLGIDRAIQIYQTALERYKSR